MEIAQLVINFKKSFLKTALSIFKFFEEDCLENILFTFHKDVIIFAYFYN